MKYKPTIYAQALAEAIIENKGKGEAEMLKNFLALVRRNGDESQLRKIVDEADRLIRRSTGVRKVVVESARPLKKPAATLLKNFLKEGDVVQEKVNPELVAGMRITLDDELQFDGSLKGKLDKLFANT